MTSATYNAANELTQWGSASLTYDADGNLTGDGTNTYSWNARNQLAGITGGSTASFGYDAFGQRTTTTINGTTTNELYDGTNLVQELVGGNPAVNYLTGFAANQTFSRSDASGTSDYLTDALGSTIALTDGTGTVQTSYTYDPFGNPAASGAASSNTRQYAGMPNDGTGLAYDQARYYDPAVQRFISPDPLGFGGGSLNLYSYVGNSPTNYTDPSGTGPIAQCVVGAAFQVGFGAVGSALSGRKYTWRNALGNAATGCVFGALDPGAFGGEIGEAVGAVERGLGEAGDAGEGAETPSYSQIKRALERAYEETGGPFPKSQTPKPQGRFGSPQRTTPDGLKGYRLDPPHTGEHVGPDSPESGWHVNWWDYSQGKRRSGRGRSGGFLIR